MLAFRAIISLSAVLFFALRAYALPQGIVAAGELAGVLDDIGAGEAAGIIDIPLA